MSGLMKDLAKGPSSGFSLDRSSLRKLLLVVAIGVGVATVGAPSLVFAQDEEAVAPGDKVVYKKKTVIDLSGAVIEGELTKPEGSYIVNRKISRFSKLVRIRSDYVPELLDSANDL